MDIFVFPSRTDTLGNVVLEAFASGIPAIVTSEGGPKFRNRYKSFNSILVRKSSVRVSGSACSIQSIVVNRATRGAFIDLYARRARSFLPGLLSGRAARAEEAAEILNQDLSGL
jgi:Glycosyl transferases group 1